MKEKLAALVVKMKENKTMTIVIGVVALVLIIALIVGLVFAFSGTSYKKTVKQFAKALEDDSKVSNFVDKYVDARAIYAIGEIDDKEDYDSEFKKEYKNAKKSDYEDSADLVKTTLKYLAKANDGGKIKVKKIGKLEKYDDCKYFKQAEVTLENEDGDENDVTFIFYKGKLVSFDE